MLLGRYIKQVLEACGKQEKFSLLSPLVTLCNLILSTPYLIDLSKQFADVCCVSWVGPVRGSHTRMITILVS